MQQVKPAPACSRENLASIRLKTMLVAKHLATLAPFLPGFILCELVMNNFMGVIST
jgi:hypothetical protein